MLTDDEEMYTEQVVLLDGQAISFPIVDEKSYDISIITSESRDTNETSQDNIPKDNFGIPIIDDAIYMCFQSLFKIQPSFDFVLLQILFADPKGHVVLQASRDHSVTMKVKNRLRTLVYEQYCNDFEIGYSDALECTIATEMLARIHFIPRVRNYEVSSLLRRSTVILHPFPFGGSKTS